MATLRVRNDEFVSLADRAKFRDSENTGLAIAD
jgi:hypothetical protein